MTELALLYNYIVSDFADLLLFLQRYIRSDESKHREVNHTLANLDQNEDPVRACVVG